MVDPQSSQVVHKISIMPKTECAGSDVLWIFAYGSLIWRPHPDVVAHAHFPATLAGYERRFWQSSPDHRGVPTEMGRVCTIVPSPGAACNGIVYEVRREHRDVVLQRLFIREQCGYTPVQEYVVCGDGIVRRALVFIGDCRNEYWAGPVANESAANDARWPRAAPRWSIAATAAVIARARGHSGTNVDYLHKLHHALRTRGITDDYVSELWRAVRELLEYDDIVVSVADDFRECCGKVANGANGRETPPMTPPQRGGELSGSASALAYTRNVMPGSKEKRNHSVAVVVPPRPSVTPLGDAHADSEGCCA